MTPTRRFQPPAGRRFKLRPPAPPPRPPKPPRAPGVTLNTLRERMFQPFYDNYARGLAAIDQQSGGVLSKYADTPVTDVPDLTPEALAASRRNFEPPTPVFVPPCTRISGRVDLYVARYRRVGPVDEATPDGEVSALHAAWWAMTPDEQEEAERLLGLRRP